MRERRQAAALRERVAVLTAEADMLERRDDVTGLWNSRHFVEALTREIERSRTYGRPVALALASVDGLEEEGADTDEAMRLLGTSIGGSVRALDVACRVGSTEFGVIMAETDSRSASVAAERVLRAMARVRTPLRPPDRRPRSASPPAPPTQRRSTRWWNGRDRHCDRPAGPSAASRPRPAP